MNGELCIRIWTRSTVPESFRNLFATFDDGELENTAFVAHVPARMLHDRDFIACSTGSVAGWLGDQGRGLFRVNAVETVDHPDGDGYLVVGGCI